MSYWKKCEPGDSRESLSNYLKEKEILYAQNSILSEKRKLKQTFLDIETLKE